MRTLIILCLAFIFLSQSRVQAQFVTEWKVFDGETIVIPINPDPTFTYKYDVDWNNDGIYDDLKVSGDASHTYTPIEVPASGFQKITIRGEFPAIYLNDGPSAAKIYKIEKWGGIEWKSMERAFRGASNMTYAATDTPDLSGVTSMSLMFSGTSSFDADINHWDMSNIETTAEMFAGCTQFNADLSNWDVVQVTDMNEMFSGASSFDQNLGTWEVARVEEMSDMLINTDISKVNYDNTIIGWHAYATGQGVVQSGVEFGVTGLKFCLSIDERQELIDDYDWIFDGDIADCPFITTWSTASNWRISILTNSDYTYNYSIDWENDGIIDATEVTGDVTHTYPSTDEYQVAIYGDFPHFLSSRSGVNGQIVDINQWGSIQWQSMTESFENSWNLEYSATDTPDLSMVDNLDETFRDCFKFNGDIGDWDVSSILSMERTFRGAGVFNQSLNEWEVSNVTNMSGMFQSAFLFNHSLNSWDVTNVTDMSNMFSNAQVFNDSLTNWEVNKVTDMSGMFSSTEAFNQALDWEVSDVTDMSSMFSNAVAFNQPLNWNVTNVKNMSAMFFGAHSFNQDIESWNVINVTNMSGMFYDARAFNKPLNGWDTDNVKDMSGMFSRTVLFNYPLHEWEVINVTRMGSMFNQAQAFNQDLNEWNTDNVTHMNNMFDRASTFNGQISGWNVANVKYMTSMFSHASLFDQPLNEWETDSIINISRMFEGASSFNQNLGSWNIEQVTYSEDDDEDRTMENMLSNSGISQANYDSTLIGWSSQNVHNNIILGAINLDYCDGASARQSLIDDHNWTILGDFECGSIPPCDEIVINSNHTLRDNSWNVADGWSLMRVPDYCDDVIIEGDIGIIKTVTLTDHGLAASLEVREGAAFIVDGYTLTILRPEVTNGGDED